MNLKMFTTSEWERYASKYPAVNWDTVTMVYGDGWICADLQSRCKKAETLINRFFNTVGKWYGGNWKDEILDAVKMGIYSDIGKSYAWSVERDDEGFFYIYLNQKGSF